MFPEVNNLSQPGLLSRSVRRALCCLALAVLAVPAVLGGDAPPERSATARELDVKLALRARKALQDDKELGELNLGVRAQAGVLVLWGAVPSTALAERAVNVLRRVRGVCEVRSEVSIVADNRPSPIPVPTLSQTPTQTQSASPGTQGLLPSWTTGPPDPRDQLTVRTPVIALPPSGRTATASPPPAAVVPAVSLLAPVVAPPPAAAPTRPSAPAAPPSLATTVERLRDTDKRFSRVPVEVQGTAVYVGGGDAPAENVMAFARAVATIGGVERVVIRNGSSSR
jgi:hypothetical protein